ncbi:hypothetical protein Hanom_Chr10g00964421 [Helianthus anomalus]
MRSRLSGLNTGDLPHMALRRQDNRGDSPPRMAAKFVAALRRRQQSRGIHRPKAFGQQVIIYFTLTVGYEPRYILKIWLLTLEEGVRKRNREHQWSQPPLPVFPDILWQSGYCSCDITGDGNKCASFIRSMERSYKRGTKTPDCPKFLISKLHVTVSR